MKLAQRFLNTKIFTPRLHWVLVGICVVSLVNAFVNVPLNPYLAVGVQFITGPVAIMLAFWVSALVWLSGYPPAKYYLIAWSAFFVGSLYSLIAAPASKIAEPVARESAPYPVHSPFAIRPP